MAAVREMGDVWSLIITSWHVKEIIVPLTEIPSSQEFLLGPG